MRIDCADCLIPCCCPMILTFLLNPFPATAEHIAAALIHILHVSRRVCWPWEETDRYAWSPAWKWILLVNLNSDKFPITKWNELCLRLQYCIVKVTLGRGNWANEMNYVMNHAPGAGSIARTVEQQSSALPLYHGCPKFPITKTNEWINSMNGVLGHNSAM